MKTEVRFLVAIVLMLGVLVGTNYLFPPLEPPTPTPADSLAVPAAGDPSVPGGEAGDAPAVPPALGADPFEGEGPAAPAQEAPTIPGQGGPQVVAPAAEAGAERQVVVESPLYRFSFSPRGARLVAAEMLEYESFRGAGGPVDLLPEGSEGTMGHKLAVGRDTVDLSRLPFTVEPAEGLRLVEGGEPQTLRFTYRHPTNPFQFEVAYTFDPSMYAVGVQGSVRGVERPLLVTRLGEGIAYAEVDSAQETRSMAYVVNHVQEGIDSWSLDRDEARVVEGPLLWAAFRSKFFVMALLADTYDDVGTARYLGGMLVAPGELDERAEVQVAQSAATDGSFSYRLFMGPQEHARLSSLGEDMQEVNPYGWRFFRPIVRPFVSIIIWALTYLHDTLSIGYGWVLVIFGVLMRVVLWPLNHKAMKAQLRNMAVQPLVQDIQKRYKDNPEKLQKEMMKLYKEHGFNPLAGCLPMLLPWPVLIALFFVFQNAIEFRGVPFLWLPDLSAADPLYILPAFLALSMFAMQYVSYKSLDTENPQMKMMMYIMPPMMGFIFLNFPSGLNLYYATANVATIPQQVWIAQERKKVKKHTPPTGGPADSK